MQQEFIPQSAQVLGHDVQTVVTPQPPLLHTDTYQAPRRQIGYSLSHYDEDHGDHIVHRTVHRDMYYNPPEEHYHTLVPQPDIVTHVPITRYYSVPVNHIVNTSHVDYEQHHRVENIVTQVPTTVERQDIHHRTVTYQEPVTTMVTKTREEPYTVTHRDTVMRNVVTPTVTSTTVPVVHNQQQIVTDNHVMAVPLV